MGGTRPTGRGAGLAIVATTLTAAGIVLGLVELVRPGLLLLLLCVGTWAAMALTDPTVRRDAIVVTRHAQPDPAVVGGISHVDAVLRSPGRSWDRLAAVGVGERGHPALTGDAPLHARVSRAPRRITLRYDLSPVARGRWPIGPTVLRRRDVFGLVQAEHLLGQGEQLAVWPRLVQLELPPDVVDGMDRRSAQGTHTPQSDDTSLRGYRAGDDLRRVHWASTARRGELVVRADEYTAGRPVHVLAALSVDPEATERTISVAASLAMALSGRGRQVVLAVERLVLATPDAHGRRVLLDSTVDLRAPHDPAAAEQSLTAVLDELSGQARPRAVVAVLGALSTQTTRQLVSRMDNVPRWALVRTEDAGEAAVAATVSALRNAGWVVGRLAPEDAVGPAVTLLLSSSVGVAT